MISPLKNRPFVEIDEVASTQELAEKWVRGEVDGPLPGVIWARWQVSGRGRYERTWLAERDDSLTMSLIFSEYADHPEPWLLGMAVALAAAGALHTRVQWPNDLTLSRKKVGGILTTVAEREDGKRVPIVGIGVNLNQTQFPTEIEEKAGSLVQFGHEVYDPRRAADEVLNRLEGMPEPENWGALRQVWELFDETPGKLYRLPSGEEAQAVGIGPDGRLICSVEGETRTVMAGEAILGGAIA
jgi:BirA family biotin operon repressor/biotin-[acetyl-CoA-carboxylase] ligase